VGRAIMSLSFSMVLLRFPMLAVIMILFVFSAIELFLCLRFYRCIMQGKKEKANAAIA